MNCRGNLGVDISSIVTECSTCPLVLHTIYGEEIGAHPDEIQRLRSKVVRADARRVIFREGELCNSICVLRYGWCFNYLQLKDGRRQILNFLIPGDFFPLVSLRVPGCSMPYSVKTLTDAVICVFSDDDAKELLGIENKKNLKLDSALQRDMNFSSSRMADIGRRNASARIAHLILELELRLKIKNQVKNDIFPFPLRQDHIADALGLTVSYVNRTLRKFRESEWIIMGNRSMSITDKPALVEEVDKN